MQDIGIKMTDGLGVGSQLICADNSGAKVLEIIGVKVKKSVRRRVAGAGVGDLVAVTVKKGKFDLRKQVLYGVVIRQKKEFEREDGTRVKFEDNAGIIVSEEGLPKGSKVKGPVARESIQRFSTIGKVATMVI